MVTSNIYWKPEIGKGSKTYSQLEYTGEWVFPLVNSQHKLDSAVGGAVQEQRKINIIYGVF